MASLGNIQIVGAKMDEFEQAKKEHDLILQRQKQEKEERLASIAAKNKPKIKNKTTSVIVKEDRKARWESARTSRDSTSIQKYGRTGSRQSASTAKHNFEISVTNKNTSFMNSNGPSLYHLSPPSSTSTQAQKTRPMSLQGLPRRDDGDDDSTEEKKSSHDKLSSKKSGSNKSSNKQINGGMSPGKSKAKNKPNYTTFLVSTGKAVFPESSEKSVPGNGQNSEDSKDDKHSHDVRSTQGDTASSQNEIDTNQDGNENQPIESGVRETNGATGSSFSGECTDKNGEPEVALDVSGVGIAVEKIRNNGNSNYEQSEEFSDTKIASNTTSGENIKETDTARLTKESGSLMPGNIEGDRPLSHPEQVRKHLRKSYKLVDSPKVLKTFYVCKEFIDTISCLSAENSWMFCDGNKLILVNKHGDIQRSIQLRGKIGDFCTLSSGEVLLTHMDDRCVYSIEANGVMTLQFKTDPLLPVAVQPTHEGNLLVTLADIWDYKIEPQSQRVLRLYSRDGRVLKTLENGPLHERLFCKPGRVRINFNTSEIAVCNFVNDEPGKDHVIFIDKEFNILFRSIEKYQIPSSFSSQSHVIFDDLVFDSGDNLIVVETCSNSVQLLDKNCRYLKTLYKDPDGQDHPMSVALDTEGNLWVGFQNGHVSIMKYRTQVLDVQET